MAVPLVCERAVCSEGKDGHGCVDCACPCDFLEKGEGRGRRSCSVHTAGTNPYVKQTNGSMHEILVTRTLLRVDLELVLGSLGYRYTPNSTKQASTTFIYIDIAYKAINSSSNSGFDVGVPILLPSLQHRVINENDTLKMEEDT